MLLIGQMLTAPGEHFCSTVFCFVRGREEDEAAVYERWEGCGPRAITNVSALSPKQVQHIDRAEPWRANKYAGMYEIHSPLLGCISSAERGGAVSAGRAAHYGGGGLYPHHLFPVLVSSAASLWAAVLCA